LADALERYDSLGHAAIEQIVFGRFCGQLADRRQPQIDGRRRQISRFQSATVLMKDGSIARLIGGRVSAAYSLMRFMLTRCRAMPFRQP
jgi:hypothetical protein